MKLLRHLLSHIILILVMFGIVSLYYYRHQVLPDKYAGKIDSYAEKIHPKLKSFARIMHVNKDVVVEDDASQTVAVTSNVIISDVEAKEKVKSSDANPIPETKVNSVEENKLGEDIKLVENIKPVKQIEEVKPIEDVKKVQSVTATETPLTSIVSSNTQVDTITIDKPENVTQIVSPETKEIIASVEEKEAPVTDKESASTYDLLSAARQAFNHGKLDLAVTQYNLLIDLDNDEADFYGELGNVYYAKGSWDKAGSAYYEAAVRLIEKRQFGQIHYLQRVLQGLNMALAEKLAIKLANFN